MDRETLTRAIDDGPVRVHMNDGASYEIPDHKSVLVNSSIAYVLHRRADGTLGAVWLSLVSMTRVERIEMAA